MSNEWEVQWVDDDGAVTVGRNGRPQMSYDGPVRSKTFPTRFEAMAFRDGMGWGAIVFIGEGMRVERARP